MCGIAGFVRRSGGSVASNVAETAGRMANVLCHRGPDDRGVWTDESLGMAFAHTRLSILDVSTSGHQPMLSHNGRYVVVFNGEMYNFRRLRSRLEERGCFFRGDSDTEVLVESFAHDGIGTTLEQAVGMFAIAVWDRDTRELTLARDRLGEKPLYYGWLGSTFVFASELKALREHPDWEGLIDRAALTLYMRHGYVPSPRTIYRGISKLPAASVLRITDFTPGTVGCLKAYWKIGQSRGTVEPIGSDLQAIDRLEALLRDAVQQQMVADVPLGAFLSGGVDSTTVVALMQSISTLPVRTFTIGVEDPRHDEAAAAARIAHHLGTDHSEVYVRSDDALALIPTLSRIYDEPFADSSQIPTILVSKLARKSVTVSLSGDGGDELFGGYATYTRGAYLHGRLKWVPPVFQKYLSRALLSRSERGGYSHPTDIAKAIGDRAVRLGEMLQEASPLAIHRALYSHWLQPAAIVIDGVEPPSIFTSMPYPWSERSFPERMLLVDASTYLPDDLLVKVDRAAMSVSLETRVPMLDHRVVEFAMRLPWSLKVRGGQRKWVLRQVLDRYVPQALMDQPKKGFSVPIAEWLRGPLRDWAAKLLDCDRIRAEGYFRPEPIVDKWQEHLSRKNDWSSALWTVLMFQAWLEAQKS